MIVRVVMARYKDEANGRPKQANIEIGKQLTERMKEEISSVRQIEVGVNLLPHPGGFDTASYAEFDDMKGAIEAITHPAHDRLTEFLNEVTDDRNFVIYEVAR